MWRFPKVITPVSNLPGGVALQPANPANARMQMPGIRRDTSVHHVHCQFHPAVTRAAEDGALTNKVAGLVGGERQLRSTTFIDLDIQIEIAEAQTMRDVVALDDKD